MPDSENTSLLAMKDSPIDYGEFTVELFENGSIDDLQSFRKKNANKSINDIFSANLQQKFRFKALKTNYEKKKKEKEGTSNNSKKEKKQENQSQYSGISYNSNGWTMIYDEGYELKIENIKVLVFNQYFKSSGKWKSNCSNTLVGWFRDEASDTYGCIRG